MTAQIKESTKLNILTSIWIVPTIAMLIALWLAFEHYSSIGPEIKIHFETNEGLEVEQGQIRYRDIPIGKIIDIQIRKNGDGITVVANINSKFSDLINKNNKFWIVKPEINTLGISGLSTLISGTYIDMYKGDGEKEARDFIGLEHPYRETGTGNNYVLTASTGHGFSAGVPIFYKSTEIGQIEKTNVNEDGANVQFTVSIAEQYTAYVQTDSKFWVKSTVSIGLYDGTLGIEVAPLSALVRGGIMLSSSESNTGSIAPNGSSFELFANKQAAKAYKLGQGEAFIETFEINTMASTINLATGAKVKYKGYQIGTVKSITPYFSGSVQQLKTKVLLDIDLSSFANPSKPETGKARFYASVKSGLSTKITSSSPVFSDLFVDLVFDKNNTKQSILEKKPYAVLPTVHVNSTPIKDILTNLNQITENINAMSAKKSFKNLPDELTKTMKALTQTLHSVEKVARGEGNSVLSAQITQTLKTVGKTSKEMQQFLDILNNKPNALIFGD